jgi:hypothetical protein
MCTRGKAVAWGSAQQATSPLTHGACSNQYGDCFTFNLYSRNANKFSAAPSVTATDHLGGSQHRVRWCAYWCIPELPTALYAMYDHSWTHTTWRRDTVLRQVTFHTIQIPGRWCHVTYCSWTSMLHDGCGSQDADVNFFHIYVVVLPVIEIQTTYTVKHNIILLCNSWRHVSVHQFKNKSTYGTVKWDLTSMLQTFLWYFKFSNLYQLCDF